MSTPTATDVAPFWDAARAGRLLIQHCERCGERQFALPGRTAGISRCRRCAAPSPPWVPARGTGTLVSHTVVHGRPPASGEPAVVRVAGIVQLTEGPWVHAGIDADPATLEPGLALVVGFEGGDEGAPPRPVFRPA